MTQLIDVGGYRVAADITATGNPVVVYVAAWGDGRVVWQQLMDHVGPRRRALVYDRAGVGDSEPRPDHDLPRTYRDLADELAMLLELLDIREPVVLVGHSFGASIVRAFAAAHPDRVAGLVLIDGSVDELCLLPDDFPATDGPGPQATAVHYAASAAELATAVYPAVPSVVVSRTPGRWTGRLADAAVDARWTNHQATTAASLNAVWLQAVNAGHYAHRDAPDLVALAINAVCIAVAEQIPTIRLTADRVGLVAGSIMRTPSDCG